MGHASWLHIHSARVPGQRSGTSGNVTHEDQSFSATVQRGVCSIPTHKIRYEVGLLFSPALRCG